MCTQVCVSVCALAWVCTAVCAHVCTIMFLAHTLPHFQRVRGLLEWTASSGRVSPETAAPQVTSVSPGLGPLCWGSPCTFLSSRSWLLISTPWGQNLRDHSRFLDCTERPQSPGKPTDSCSRNRRRRHLLKCVGGPAGVRAGGSGGQQRGGQPALRRPSWARSRELSLSRAPEHLTSRRG